MDGDGGMYTVDARRWASHANGETSGLDGGVSKVEGQTSDHDDGQYSVGVDGETRDRAARCTVDAGAARSVTKDDGKTSDQNAWGDRVEGGMWNTQGGGMRRRKS